MDITNKCGDAFQIVHTGMGRMRCVPNGVYNVTVGAWAQAMRAGAYNVRLDRAGMKAGGGLAVLVVPKGEPVTVLANTFRAKETEIEPGTEATAPTGIVGHVSTHEFAKGVVILREGDTVAIDWMYTRYGPGSQHPGRTDSPGQTGPHPPLALMLEPFAPLKYGDFNEQVLTANRRGP